MRYCVLLVVMLLAMPALSRPAAAQGGAAPAVATPALGPSFSCPVPRDPLAALICSDAGLARADLLFTQTYDALLQQGGPAGQRALQAEAASFTQRVRAACGIANPQATPSAPAPQPAPASAIPCVAGHYARERDALAARLTGPANEEARRPIEEQIALQRDLQAIGILPPIDRIDGVYGTYTRYAITSFQTAMGLAPTGLLGDADADALEQQARMHATQAAQRPLPTAPATPAQPATPAAAPRSVAWDRFEAEQRAAGLRVALKDADGDCTITLDIHDPDSFGSATRQHDQAAGGTVRDDDAPHLFSAELVYLRTVIAAATIHAAFATDLQAQTCTVRASAYTVDVYGRDVPQPLFHFTFARDTYEKIVWERFDPANLPKLVGNFELGAFAQAELRLLPDAPKQATQPMTAPADAPPLPAAPPPPTPRPAPVTTANVTPPPAAVQPISLEDFLLDRARYMHEAGGGGAVSVQGVLENCTDGRMCFLTGNGQSAIVNVEGLPRKDRKHLLESCGHDGMRCPATVTGRADPGVTALTLTAIAWP